jgi:hypothetical protein
MGQAERKGVATRARAIVLVTPGDSLISSTNDRFCAVAASPRGIALMGRHLVYKISGSYRAAISPSSERG